jgi:hypothetical protein
MTTGYLFIHAQSAVADSLLGPVARLPVLV